MKYVCLKTSFVSFYSPSLIYTAMCLVSVYANITVKDVCEGYIAFLFLVKGEPE